MKKILLGLAAGLIVVACNEPASIAHAPKNTELIYMNFKGKVQRLEETDYKVDSVSAQATEMDSCCTWIEEFDELGYSKGFTKQDSKGTITEENTFTRWENGNGKDIIKMNKGKLISKFTTTLKKDGSYLGAMNFDSTGKMDAYYTDITSDTVYHLATGWKRFKPDSTLHSIGIREFDKAWFTSFSETDSTGKVVKTIKTKNNDKGDPIETTTVEMKKDTTTTKVQTFKYDGFDEKGNWTLRTEFENGKPVRAFKRRITYYKD